jgi:hypothetical protein
LLSLYSSTRFALLFRSLSSPDNKKGPQRAISGRFPR